MRFLLRQWFLWGVALACLIGWSRPGLGELLSPSIPWLVASIMFLMGVGQDVSRLWKSLRNLTAVLFTLSNNFLVMPALCFLAGKLLFPSDPVLFAGMLVLGSAPTTTASSIVWTRQSQGNTSLSLVLTVASTLASVVTIPVILSVTLGRTVELPAGEVMGTLVMIVLVPVLGAQLLRWRFSGVQSLERINRPFGHALILLIVLTAVARSAGHLNPSLVLQILGAAALLNLGISLFSYHGGRFLRLEPADTRAVLFGSSQKAITIGMVVGLLYFEPLAGLPILVYHVFQQLSAYLWAEFLGRAGPGPPHR